MSWVVYGSSAEDFVDVDHGVVFRVVVRTGFGIWFFGESGRLLERR